MRFLLILIASLSIMMVGSATVAQACEYNGQCLNNQTCVCVFGCGTSYEVLAQTGGECGSADLGAISAPQGVQEYDLQAGGSGNIGLLEFVSTLLRIVTIGAGLWTVGNFAFAGIRFVAAFGEPKVYSEVKDSVTWSLIGLVIIAASYLLAGIIGLMFFGDAGFLLNPQLQGALTPVIP